MDYMHVVNIKKAILTFCLVSAIDVRPCRNFWCWCFKSHEIDIIIVESTIRSTYKHPKATHWFPPPYIFILPRDFLDLESRVKKAHLYQPFIFSIDLGPDQQLAKSDSKPHETQFNAAATRDVRAVLSDLKTGWSKVWSTHDSRNLSATKAAEPQSNTNTSASPNYPGSNQQL